jgi:speckle-type POZ protein
MPRGKLVAVDHVDGKQQERVVRVQILSETHTIRFVFHDLEKLSHNRGDMTRSSVLLCHGCQWKLGLSPGGDDVSSEDLGLYLKCVSAESGDCEVKSKFSFRVPSFSSSRDMNDMNEHIFKSGSSVLRSKNSLLRSDVLDPSKGFLVDGNLIIEVDIQVYKDASPFWEPKSELNADFMKVLESANQSGDVNFQVGSEVFSAHRHILEPRAPVLAALTEDCPSDTLIPIHDIKPSVFRSLLRFVYANDVENLRNEARELLDVADRFGCKGLKLAAEAELVASGISVDTVADLILLGDSKNCALLKEAAIEFFAENAKSVKASPGWAKLRESADLLDELMEVLVNNNKKRSTPADADEMKDYKHMCISSLRQMLDEKGFDVDGSREMLINRLEERENDDGSGNASDEE